jgi:ELWxxDGT repeat protein
MKYALYLLFALSSVFGTAQSIPYTIELIDRNQTPTFFKELYGLLEADDGVYFAHEFGFAPTLYVVSYFDGVNYTELYTSSGKLLLMEAIQGSVFVTENTDGATGDDNILLVRQTGSVDTVSTDPFSFMPDTYERNDIMIVTSSGEHILAYNADGEEEILANNPSGSGFIFQFNDYGERTLMHARNNYYFTDGTAAGTTRVFEEATGGFNVNLFPYANSLVLVDNDGIASYDFVTTQTQYVTSNEYSSRDNATLSPNGILFTARNTASERKIYVTDGTEEGTTVLTSLPPGLENGIEEFYDFYEGVSSPHIFFSPVQTGDSRQIWVSDGTYDGTYMLFEVPAEVSATVRLKQPGVSNDDVIVTANVEASGDNSLYVYRYKPTQPNITATLLAILTENSAFSIHLINDYLLYGAGSFFEETLYALDLITGDTTSLGIVRENIQEPLMELSDQIFYLNGGDNNTIDTIVATRGPEAGLRPIIATNSRTYSSSLPTSLFFIEDELYAYIFDVVTGESIVRIDRQMLTTSLVVDLFPNNSSSANADMAEVGGRLLVRGDNSMQIFSGGSVTSTISTFGDPAFSSLNRLIGNIGDKYYFDKTSFTFTIGLYELDIVTGEIRDLTFLLQNEFGNQDDAFVIVNDKIYTIGTSIEDDSYLNTFMEIDPEASTATVISTTHGGGPTQLNNRSLATDGSVIYLTRNLVRQD